MNFAKTDPLDLTPQALAIGTGGWVFWDVAAMTHEVRARIVETGNGRLAIGAIWVWAYDSLETGVVSAVDLRDVQLGRLERLVNRPDLAAAIREGVAAPKGPSFDPARCRGGTAHDVAASLPLALNEQPLRVTIPPGSRKPDAFYEAIASVYATAASTSAQPALDIAAVNQVAVEQVYAWTKEARRRGLMAPGRRMKRNADP